jgi:hypothetical protein
MSFLNPFLLLATLGIALPILAHLLNRQQVKRTDWAAMQFLNRNLRVRSRQLRLRDILLLILRCLALLLLVFALARPTWTGVGGSWFSGEARAGVVLGIDSSFSMEHGSEGATRFNRALDQARVIAEQLLPGDPVSIILLGGKDDVIARNMAFDPDRFEALLQEAKPVPAGIDLERVPKRLKELLDDMDAPQKEAYFITDAQGKDWQRASPHFQSALSDLSEEAQVVFVPVLGTSGNLAVINFELASGTLRKGTTARYQATVRNCGDKPVAAVQVLCRVEGVQIDTKPIPLINAGSSETVSLFVPFHNSGATRITAEVSGDLLSTDNVRHVVAVVRDRVSVLCVDGSDGSSGRLIRAALLARGEGIEDEGYLVRSIPWISMPSQKLEDVDVVILSDVPEITPEQAERFSRHVRQGNGLVWFPGDNIKTAVWNDRISKGGVSLLPAVLGQPKRTGEYEGIGIPLNPFMPNHGVTLPLLSLPEDLLSETLFLRRLQVEPSPASFPILSLAGSGAPILLEHSLGRGHVFMFTSSAGTSWNNMAQTPVFPMLMQQIVTYLAGREFERPRVVGDSISLSYVDQPDATDAVFDTPSDQTIIVPVLEHRNQFVAMLENSQEVGFYEARVSVQAPGVPVAVNVDASESEVTTLTPAQLNANLKGTGVTITNSEAELSAAIEANRTERSFWRNFMIAGLIFLLVESLFAERLGRSKRTSEKQPDLLTETPTGVQDA